MTWTMRRGHHRRLIMGLWWWQLHSRPGMGGLFPLLPLTFPCRCWNIWPLHRVVPRCLWVLLMEWSAPEFMCVCRKCTVIVYERVLVCFNCTTLCMCVCACARVPTVDSAGAAKPFGPRAGNSIWHEHSEDYLCPDSYCLTDNKSSHHSLLKVNMLKQGGSARPEITLQKTHRGEIQGERGEVKVRRDRDRKMVGV